MSCQYQPLSNSKSNEQPKRQYYAGVLCIRAGVVFQKSGSCASLTDMHRIFKFVEQEIRGLHETAYLLGAFALLSAFLAFFRDRLLASAFGAGHTLDIYYAAFRIPDIVFISIASLVSVFVLVPVLSRTDSEEKKRAILGSVLTAFSAMMLVVTASAWVLMPTIAPLIFPKLVAEGDTLIVLSRVLLIQPIFLGLSGIFASVTQIHGRYILYAIAPVLYNISIIFGIVALYPLFGLVGIGYGVVLGALLHVVIQVPFVKSRGYLRLHDFRIEWKSLVRIVGVSIPRTLSMAANSIALFILIILAASLGVGAVSVFSLAFNLQAAPLSIIGGSYSVAAFPILARYFSNGETESFCNHIIQSTRHILFWSVPLLALFIVLRAHIVRVVLGSGEFGWEDTRLTAAALALFVVSLAAQALSLLFVRGYYAAGETLKPLVINVTTAVGVVGGAYVFVWLINTIEPFRFFIEALLRVEDLPGVDILMLPLSFALFAIINASVYMYMFERDFGVLWKHIRRALYNSFAAAIVGAFVAREVLTVLGFVFDINTFVGVFAIGLLSGIVGMVAAWGIFSLLKSQELKEVGGAARKKFWRMAPLFTRALGRREHKN